MNNRIPRSILTPISDIYNKIKNSFITHKEDYLIKNKVKCEDESYIISIINATISNKDKLKCHFANETESFLSKDCSETRLATFLANKK